jgi:hypothetical protein
MIWRAGNDLSGDRIGNLLTVAQLYGGRTFGSTNLFSSKVRFGSVRIENWTNRSL